jgi:hypothetical protein
MFWQWKAMETWHDFVQYLIFISFNYKIRQENICGFSEISDSFIVLFGCILMLYVSKQSFSQFRCKMQQLGISNSERIIVRWKKSVLFYVQWLLSGSMCTGGKATSCHCQPILRGHCVRRQSRSGWMISIQGIT